MIEVFHIQRKGTVVAHGICFPTGSVVVEWVGETPSTVVHRSMENVIRIHGHEGTEFVSIARLDDRRQHLLNNETQDHCENVGVDFVSGSPKYMWDQREKALDLVRPQPLIRHGR